MIVCMILRISSTQHSSGGPIELPENIASRLSPETAELIGPGIYLSRTPGADVDRQAQVMDHLSAKDGRDDAFLAISANQGGSIPGVRSKL
jgi:hypothetical protein